MRGIWIALAAAALAGPAGWVASDRLESDDAFCVSCHLDAETPLHREKSKLYGAVPAVNLAGAHRQTDAEFRCISCHRGTGFVGRARVKLVAARDAVRYVFGSFEEPTSMRHPLWDQDCAGCHTAYATERPDAFHALDVHNVELPIGCVECHDSHEPGTPELQFLKREVVLPRCRECHEEF